MWYRRGVPWGKVDLQNLVLLFALAGFIYGVIIFAPPVLDNLDVKEAIAISLNQAHRLSDDEIKALIIARTDDKGWHWEQNEIGEWVEVKGLGLTGDHIVIDRNTVTGVITIRVNYERRVRFKPTQLTVSLSFSPEREALLHP